MYGDVSKSEKRGIIPARARRKKTRPPINERRGKMNKSV